MSKRRIHITQFDQKRLEEMLAEVESVNLRDRKDLHELREELKEAKVVDPKKIPPTVVTMNSKIRFRDLDSDELTDITLVFPSDADFDLGRLSVMSPIGTAFLGYAEGDTIEWSVPAGKRRIKIEKVLYQPEASGDFHL